MAPVGQELALSRVSLLQLLSDGSELFGPFADQLFELPDVTAKDIRLGRNTRELALGVNHGEGAYGQLLGDPRCGLNTVFERSRPITGEDMRSRAVEMSLSPRLSTLIARARSRSVMIPTMLSSSQTTKHEICFLYIFPAALEFHEPRLGCGAQPVFD